MKLDLTVDMMLSDDYKERFKAEYHQLTWRINKLQKVIRDYKDGNLKFDLKCDYYLLLWQLKTMQEYQSILKHRADVEGIDIYTSKKK